MLKTTSVYILLHFIKLVHIMLTSTCTTINHNFTIITKIRVCMGSVRWKLLGRIAGKVFSIQVKTRHHFGYGWCCLGRLQVLIHYIEESYLAHLFHLL